MRRKKEEKRKKEKPFPLYQERQCHMGMVYVKRTVTGKTSKAEMNKI